MKLFKIKKAGKKGYGVYAARNIKEGQHVIRCDLTRLRAYSPNKVKSHPQHESNHWDEVGNNRFVLDFSPASYVNHSCDPNCCTKYYTLKRKDIVAMSSIKKGEELTVDYSTVSIYGFGRRDYLTSGSKTMKCRCGSKKCRKIITSDFFELPKGLQRKYYQNLPPSIKRKFNHKVKKLLR